MRTRDQGAAIAMDMPVLHWAVLFVIAAHPATLAAMVRAPLELMSAVIFASAILALPPLSPVRAMGTGAAIAGMAASGPWGLAAALPLLAGAVLTYPWKAARGYGLTLILIEALPATIGFALWGQWLPLPDIQPDLFWAVIAPVLFAPLPVLLGSEKRLDAKIALPAGALWLAAIASASFGLDPVAAAGLIAPATYAMCATRGRRFQPIRPRRIAAATAGMLLAATLGVHELARAGAWVQRAGQSLFIIRAGGAQGEGRFDPEGDKILPQPFGRGALSVYGEYGLTESLTLLADTRLHVFAGRIEAGGDAGLRLRLFDEDGIVISAEARAGMPASEPGALLREADNRLQTEIAGLVGWGGEAWGSAVYFSAEAGYRWRSENFGDVILLTLSGGIDVTDAWQLMFSLRNEIVEEGIPQSGFRLHKAQIAALYRLEENAALELGISHTYAGRNADKETEIFAGVWIRF